MRSWEQIVEEDFPFEEYANLTEEERLQQLVAARPLAERYLGPELAAAFEEAALQSMADERKRNAEAGTPPATEESAPEPEPAPESAPEA